MAFFGLSPVSTAVTYDKSIKAIKVKVPDSDEEFLLHPATVRRNDRSAQSVVCRKFFRKWFIVPGDLCTLNAISVILIVLLFFGRTTY